jgi:predicted CXXCH cytochrome family protein
VKSRKHSPGRATSGRHTRVSALVAIVVGVAAAALLVARLHLARGWGEPRGSELTRRADYTGSAACASCHGAETKAWAGSHHGLAMREPSPRTVLGDFGGATFTDAGVTTRFFTRGGRYFAATEGADGKPAEFEVKHVIGVRPVQQYVFELAGGKLQCLTVAWDTEKRRWYSLYPGQRIALDDPLHWTGRYQNWNLMCAECHTTDFRKGYDAGKDSYASSWAEFDVGCETCHGPGKAHVEWARRAPRSGAARARGRDTKLAVVLEGGDAGAGAAPGGATIAAARAEVDACAPCHSRRHRIGAALGPSGPFLDEFDPEVMREPLYFADGQIHDEVYEYGSFRQSRMYQRGVRCSDCHDPHAATLRAEGNALCVRCHQPHPDPRFPTLAAKEYDAPSHHHHAAGSAGAQCVACHMPQRNYMVVDARRDHFIRAPRPDVTVTHGTPNACNGCHADRAPEWAAGAVDSWFGAHPRDSSFVHAVAAGRAGDHAAAPLLAQLAADTNRTAMARATALDLLRAFPGASDVAFGAARDPDPLVRAAAAGATETLPPAERVPLEAPLLEDPVRAVRVAAARILAGAPRGLLSSRQQRGLDAALRELAGGLDAMADMPSTYLNFAVLDEARGRDDRAEQSYRRALAMDPYFLPARANLATLYNRTGRNADAERELREGIRRQPEEGELHYSLGLVLAEEEHYDSAAVALERAAKLIPQRARVRFNLALTLAKLGREADADRMLFEANHLDPLDADILYAAAYRLVERGEWARALPLALELTELRPGDRDAQGLLQRIRSATDSHP